MADFDDEAAAEARKKRSFKKFTYRGVELEALLDLGTEQVCLYCLCALQVG